MNYCGFLINIAIMVFLLVDAPKHGKNPTLWAILGLFFGWIPLGIYLIQTERKGWGIAVLCIGGALCLITILLMIIFVAVMATQCGAGVGC